MECLRQILYRWSIAYVMLVASQGAQAQAVEFVANQVPAPDSVEELHGPIVLAFPDADAPPSPLLGSFSDYPKQFHPFLSEMTMDANFRSFYFLRDNGTTSLHEKSEAWAGLKKIHR